MCFVNRKSHCLLKTAYCLPGYPLPLPPQNAKLGLMTQALYRKWRPIHFEQIIGQDHVTHTLKNSVTADRVGHAYLFCGPRGTGKTTSARLLAKAVNCLQEDAGKRPCNECIVCKAVNAGRFLDLIEIDAASNTGVDDIRDLRDKINFAPNQGRFKVYIIDEVHMLSTAAFNALLKTLEEPPAHAMFVLATTEEHKVPLTIKSRCQQFNFRLLSTIEIKRRLAWLAEQEDLTLEPGVLDMIALHAAGSARDGESLLDQLVIAPGDSITVERTQMVLGTAANTSVVDLTDAWLDGNGAVGLQIIHSALASGADVRQFCRQMVVHLRQLLLLQAAGADVAFEIPTEQKEPMLAQANRAPRQGLIDAIKAFQDAALTQTGSWQPQLPLELAFIELLPDESVLVPKMREERVTAVAPTPPPAMVKESVPPPLIKQKDIPPVKPEPEPQKDIGQVTTSTGSVPASTGSVPASTDPVPASTDPVPALTGSVPTPMPAATQSISLKSIQQQWPTMIKRVGQQFKNLPPLLAMCKPLAVENGTIVLGFDYPIFKDKFDKMPEASRAISETYTNILNTHCNVRCVVTSEYTVPIEKDAFEALAQELGGVVREEG